jgi:hypothetical protein
MIIRLFNDNAVWLAGGLVGSVATGYALDGLTAFGWLTYIATWLLAFVGIGQIARRLGRKT